MEISSSIMKFSIFYMIMMIILSFFDNNVVVAENFLARSGRLVKLPTLSSSSTSTVVNVVDYGALGDGLTDDSKAFVEAWERACKGKNQGQVVYKVPAGKTFFLKPFKFLGPCKSSSINVQIEGKLEAPKTMKDWGNSKSFHSWIEFSEISGLDINGSGQLEGHGSLWWNNNISNKKCGLPTALLFHRSNDMRIQGLTHLNSPQIHISINDCKNVELSNLQIIAPQNSPNTHHSQIGTGDDCIAINGGSSFINVDNVICGPGHGISVGSLGRDGAYDTVTAVLVKNCTFIESQNGARIKTWEGGLGFARNITFEHIIFNKTHNPIIINQHYIDQHYSSNKHVQASTAVQIQDVTYRNMHGTSATERAINLLCSEKASCLNIRFQKVHISSYVRGKSTKAYGENVQVRELTSTSPKLVLGN